MVPISKCINMLVPRKISILFLKWIRENLLNYIDIKLSYLLFLKWNTNKGNMRYWSYVRCRKKKMKYCKKKTIPKKKIWNENAFVISEYCSFWSELVWFYLLLLLFFIWKQCIPIPVLKYEKSNKLEHSYWKNPVLTILLRTHKYIKCNLITNYPESIIIFHYAELFLRWSYFFICRLVLITNWLKT